MAAPSHFPQLPLQAPGLPKTHKQAAARRPFRPEEDARLIQILSSAPFRCWDAVAQQFENRTPRQCRERWLNYLCPQVRIAPWTKQEDELLVAMVNEHCRAWSVISRWFNGRSENDVKNRWYSHLRHETAYAGTQLVLVRDRPLQPRAAQKKRRRPVVDPKENARRLLGNASGQEPFASSQACGEDRFARGGAADEAESVGSWFGSALDGFEPGEFGTFD
jgi:hypothetical protein